MKKKVFFLLVICLSFCAHTLRAQETAYFSNENKKYRDAIELFDAAKYGAAQKLFDEVIAQSKDAQSYTTADAYYYSALCAVFLYNKTAESRVAQFIELYPQNSKINIALFHLGNAQYTDKKYTDALATFERVTPTDLPDEVTNEYYFKLGYCYFLQNNLPKAKNAFYIVKSNDCKYTSPGLYYYAHILYSEKDYSGALLDFEKLTEDPNFKEIVPFYITQIYYLQGRSKELLAYAPNVIEKASPKRRSEILRMIAETYLKEKQYKNAITYYNQYISTTQAPSNADYYQVGFCYYQLDDFESASNHFEKVVPGNDSLSQNTLYHLGNCRLKLNDKEGARSAFLEASRTDFDKQIAEESLFNYAKLSVEVPNNAYNESIKSFLLYLEKYPDTKHRNEINEIMANLYFSVRNYKDALALIENISPKTKTVNEATQRIALNRGIELFNESKYDEATPLFEKTLKHDYNDALTSAALYLLGETYYRKQDYASAEKELKDFFVSVGGENSIYQPTACYTMGYCLLKQKKYTPAIEYYQRFVKTNPDNKKTLADAYNRMGDCEFINKRFKPAIEYYDKNIALAGLDADYALYQKALSLGATGNYNGKIEALSKLSKQYANSTYVPAAYFEMGNTSLLLEKNTDAIKSYQQLLTNYPQSAFNKDAMLKLGMAEYTTGNDNNALQWFDKLQKTYPNSSESYEALVTTKNIYVAQNRIEDYFAYVKTVSDKNVSSSEKDSLTYNTAESRYLEGDCDASTKGFESYLLKYPNGYFVLNANYYAADCYFREGKYELALPYYEAIVQKPKSDYTEKSLLNASRISFDMKEYGKAVDYYAQLIILSDAASSKSLGKIGVMRSYYRLQDYSQAIVAGQEVLKIEKLSEETVDEALHILAYSAYLLNDTILARDSYKKLQKSKNGEYSGEAYYRLAERLYKENRSVDAEKVIVQVTANPTSEYWLAKSFILWAHIFEKKGNLLQAKQTLQSIIDNYDGEEVKQEAQLEYNRIVGLEQKQKEAKEQKALKQKEDVETIDLSTSKSDTTATE